MNNNSNNNLNNNIERNTNYKKGRNEKYNLGVIFKPQTMGQKNDTKAIAQTAIFAAIINVVSHLLLINFI
jgi:hypothetical protein